MYSQLPRALLPHPSFARLPYCQCCYLHVHTLPVPLLLALAGGLLLAVCAIRTALWLWRGSRSLNGAYPSLLQVRVGFVQMLMWWVLVI
jgi:hypothetical protein